MQMAEETSTETTEATEGKEKKSGAMYAWNNFVTEVNEYGQPVKRIMPGDKISAAELNISDEEFENLVSLGAVRDEPYPDIPKDVSPAEYERARDALLFKKADMEAQLKNIANQITGPRSATNAEDDPLVTTGEAEAAAEKQAAETKAASTTTATKPAAKPAAGSSTS